LLIILVIAPCLDAAYVVTMSTKDHSPKSFFKAVIAACGSIVFLVVSIVVACKARHYQISGQPMPNGKGGFMTYGDGYMIALVFLLFSVAWFVAARKFWRERPV
jgi:hypothetical protein